MEVGTIIGIVGIAVAVIGIVFAFIFYRCSRIGAQPVYQLETLNLIGKDPTIPEDVEILFKGKSVSQLTKTHIILWNTGKSMLEGKNIVAEDPLRLEFSEPVELLRVSILKRTRELNKFTANIKQGSPNTAICNFDYLEPKDGVLIELLHTAKESYPQVKGTIRGVPKGVQNWGKVPPEMKSLDFYFSLLFGIGCIGYGLFLCFIKSERDGVWVVGFGLFLLFPILTRMWIGRKRYPKSLAIE